ncbi:hypothetical protein Psfp_03777 [Pelotomaculum sp. FP]|uniref:hypothetical protein n=1 Tax=Pelotomaculum sp. FP TaxID=261474 RepID=UPI001066F79A|nr:hypothetical protein [Pelotomaculum sp. FP]TEB12296.1 hypothetical protein Psfp_03777 [Pelotomaculum sp. FP]
MANTRELKIVSEYAINKAAEVLGVTLERKSVRIGSIKSKIFDGVSSDGKIVAKVINHSGLTSGNNKPNAKIRNTFAECYFLSLTESLNRYLVMTDPEFYHIFKDESAGLLVANNIQLLLVELPTEYRNIVSRVTKQASEEMR